MGQYGFGRGSAPALDGVGAGFGRTEFGPDESGGRPGYEGGGLVAGVWPNCHTPSTRPRLAHTYRESDRTP